VKFCSHYGSNRVCFEHGLRSKCCSRQWVQKNISLAAESELIMEEKCQGKAAAMLGVTNLLLAKESSLNMGRLNTDKALIALLYI
jgi:hypothetical protein